VAFGLDRIDPDRDITLHLIEAAGRILPALPSRIATAATELLTGLGVKVYTSARVAAVVPNGVKLADGRIIDAELVVWAAGVKAPAFRLSLAGTQHNRAAARPGGASAVDTSVETAAAKTRRTAARALALSRLRFIGIVRPIQHRRQLDGQVGRSGFVRRRLFCAVDVCVALQNARIRAASLTGAPSRR